jgi:hypothetical protein
MFACSEVSRSSFSYIMIATWCGEMVSTNMALCEANMQLTYLRERADGAYT